MFLVALLLAAQSEHICALGVGVVSSHADPDYDDAFVTPIYQRDETKFPFETTTYADAANDVHGRDSAFRSVEINAPGNVDILRRTSPMMRRQNARNPISKKSLSKDEIHLLERRHWGAGVEFEVGASGHTAVIAGAESQTSTLRADLHCDWQCYLENYKDLQNAFGQHNVEAAAQHYDQFGKKEGRDCTCRGKCVCDWQCYLDNYNDLRQALGENNVAAAKQHFEKHGKKEGRDCTCHSKCDWQCYLDNYEDLQKAFGQTNVKAAAKHFVNHGKAEGRDCTCGSNHNMLFVACGTQQMLSTDAKQFDRVVVEGVLRCPTDAQHHARLDTGRLEVRGHGVFECGTQNDPVRGRIEILLRGKERSIRVESGGVLKMHGNVAQSLRTRLARVGKPGDVIVHTRESVDRSWNIGDVVVVATTAFHKQVDKQWEDHLSPRLGQNEVRTIVQIVGAKSVKLSEPLKYSHYGGQPQTFAGGNFKLDEAAHVVNLNRTIYISAASGEGGDVMVMRGGHLFANAVEFANLGVAGHMGRYPVHWHKAGDVHGQYLKASSIHDSQQRCVVIHGTDHAIVEDNTCFNFFGHGIFLEDGDEQQNMISRNILILAKKPLASNALLQSEIDDVSVTRFPAPAGIWVSHPTNSFVGNVVIASEGSGIWMSFVPHLCCTTVQSCEMKAQCEAPAQYHSPSHARTLRFDNNVAASCVVGMNWDGAPKGKLRGNALNSRNDRAIEIVFYDPPDVPTFKGNVIYKSSNSALYIRSSTAVFDGWVMADNGFGPVFAYNNILKNSLIVGWSANAEVDFFYDQTVRPPIKMKATGAGQQRFSGIHAYDGPWVLENLHVAGFPSEVIFLDGTNEDITPVVFAAVGAHDRFNNWAKHVTFVGKAQPKYMVGDLYQAASFYWDEGGRRTSVVGNYPINFDRSCQRNLWHGAGTLACMGLQLSYLVSTHTSKPYKNIRYIRSRSSRECGWQCYLDRYADLKKEFGPTNIERARLHYETQGSREGRDCTCACDWQCYLDNYADLQKAFGPTSVSAAAGHYGKHGEAEGRDCTCPVYDTWEDFPDQIPRSFFQMIQSKDYRYHITIPDMRAPKETFHFRADNRNAISPPIYIEYGAHCDKAKVGPSFDEVSSEKDMLDASSNVVHYLPYRRLALRVVASQSTESRTKAVYPGSPSAFIADFWIHCQGQFRSFSRRPELEFPNIKGHLDAFVVEPDGVKVSGWACNVGKDVAIEVEVQANEALIRQGVANLPSGTGVQAACKNSAAHRFNFRTPALPAGDLVITVTARLGRARMLLRKERRSRGTSFSKWLATHRGEASSGYVS